MLLRKNQHQTMFRHKFDLVAYVLGTREDERHMHDLLGHNRNMHLPSREWYMLTANMKEIIDLFIENQTFNQVVEKGVSRNLFTIHQNTSYPEWPFTSNDYFCSISSLAFLLKINEATIRNSIQRMNIKTSRYDRLLTEYDDRLQPEMIRWKDAIEVYKEIMSGEAA